MMQSIHQIYRSNENWMSKSGAIFGTWSIFNPNGPTIYCVGATNCGEPDIKVVFLRWINPFEQGAFGLGLLDVTHPKWPTNLAYILHRALTVESGTFNGKFDPLTCIPSLITVSEDENIKGGFVGMLRGGLRRRSFDWGQEHALLKRYGTDLFARAGAELRQAVDQLEVERKAGAPVDEEFLALARIRYSQIPSFVNWSDTPFTTEPFSDAAFDAWMERLLPDDFRFAGYALLAEAWVGSIDFVKESNKLKTAARLEEVNVFLWHFNHPIWPKEWTTKELAQRMQLHTSN